MRYCSLPKQPLWLSLSMCYVALLPQVTLAADKAVDSEGYQVMSYDFGSYSYDYGALPNTAKNTPTQQNAPLSPPQTPALSITDNTVELQVRGDYNFSPSYDVQGGASYGLDTTLYSQTINNNWRIFAGEYYAHEEEPGAEGNISLSRSTVGVEYHDNAFKISAAPTYNYYDAIDGGNTRVGGVGDVAWTINDVWNVGTDVQIFSRDVPLRALNVGITANSYEANIGWHQGDQRSLRIDDEAMTFSDDNVRNSVDGVYTERLWAYNNNFTLDGLINEVESQDSLNENRLYYNPKLDLLSSAGLQATQVLYRDGDNVYRQSLQVLPGDYWEENYGNSFAVNGRYELRATLGNSFDVGGGAAYSHQAADGVTSNSVTFLFDLTKRL